GQGWQGWLVHGRIDPLRRRQDVRYEFPEVDAEVVLAAVDNPLIHLVEWLDPVVIATVMDLDCESVFRFEPLAAVVGDDALTQKPPEQADEAVDALGRLLDDGRLPLQELVEVLHRLPRVSKRLDATLFAELLGDQRGVGTELLELGHGKHLIS